MDAAKTGAIQRQTHINRRRRRLPHQESNPLRNRRQSRLPKRVHRTNSLPHRVQRMISPTLQTCQNCQKINQLTQENLTLKKEIDSLKRSLMLHENPHTPSSRRMYPTRNGDHTKSTKRFPGRPKGYKGTTRPKPKLIDITKAPEKKCACNHCGAPLNEPTRVGHHVFEEIANQSQSKLSTSCNSNTNAKHATPTLLQGIQIAHQRASLEKTR